MTTTPSSPAKASPVKALQEIVAKKVSGRLTIIESDNIGVCWQLYVGEGKIHFAHSNVAQQERLFYLLHKHHPELQLSKSDWQESQSDYDYICSYWRSGKLNLNQVRQVLQVLLEEALVQVLKIPSAELQFHKTIGLDPILLSLPLKEIVDRVGSQINAWVKIRSEIGSPLQRLSIANSQQFTNSLHLKKERNLEQNYSQYQESQSQLVESLKQVLSHNYTLYQVASELKIDVLELSQLLQPLVQQKIIAANSFNFSPETSPRPVVACIDDSKTVQRQVKLTLEAAGYEVLNITEPARAMTALVRQRPSAILMDINMPEIDGYELCKILRQSDVLKEIPIVMLTGRDGLIDRMRAHMVGATEYLTKPIEPQGLLDVLQKLITGEQK
jgi:twitching motility two-component system response regulator PilG